MLLQEYITRTGNLDRLPSLTEVKLGLFGEVGSILTTAKKHKRDGASFNYISSLIEELGDALWYFTRLIDRLGLAFEDVISEGISGGNTQDALFATTFIKYPIARAPAVDHADLNNLLPQLGISAAALLNCNTHNISEMRNALVAFINTYLSILVTTGISLSEVINDNLKKSEGRFILPELPSLPDFDGDFPEDERIPDRFTIEIVEKTNGKSYMKWNGVFIGDPLTDNVFEEDGYRFHDVLHMSHAAILGWSPTFRALIRHKRKSDVKYDEVQDGGRAIVIEEGLTAWIFSHAKEANFFAEERALSFDLLKRIRHFVVGFEVEACPVSLWEKAILDGYKVFRQLREVRKGFIVCDRISRTIDFKEHV